MICKFLENQHREGRNVLVGVNEIELKGVQWKYDSLKGKHALVKTVYRVTYSTICCLVSNSVTLPRKHTDRRRQCLSKHQHE
jgi:hypothetical protein